MFRLVEEAQRSWAGIGVLAGGVDTEAREFELQPTIKPAVPATAILRKDRLERVLFSRSTCSLVIAFPSPTLVYGFRAANLPAEQTRAESAWMDDTPNSVGWVVHSGSTACQQDRIGGFVGLTLLRGAHVKRARSLQPRKERGGKKWYGNWFAQME
jgi:hypothetical protein